MRRIGVFKRVFPAHGRAAGAGLPAATEAAAQAITRRFGDGVMDGKIKAHFVIIKR